MIMATRIAITIWLLVNVALHAHWALVISIVLIAFGMEALGATLARVISLIAQVDARITELRTLLEEQARERRNGMES